MAIDAVGFSMDGRGGQPRHRVEVDFAYELGFEVPVRQPDHTVVDLKRQAA